MLRARWLLVERLCLYCWLYLVSLFLGLLQVFSLRFFLILTGMILLEEEPLLNVAALKGQEEEDAAVSFSDHLLAFFLPRLLVLQSRRH